ncbi:MAG TPA: PEGA domain-containing protein [Candidatus Dormibacteraeota bacterium]|nr:PEGA domain-containing protein [Candidatus Dormibacteraeota bacterium]
MLLAVIALFAAGCGTIVNGTTESVVISSEPQGAMITVDNLPRGMTPNTVDLSRKAIHTVQLQKPGYVSYQATINQSSSNWIWGDVLLGGILGFLVDAGSGGMYDLQPTEVSAQLREDGQAPVANAAPAPGPIVKASMAPAPVAKPPSAQAAAALASDVHPASQQGVPGQSTATAPSLTSAP